jgi:hypothetical protein
MMFTICLSQDFFFLILANSLTDLCPSHRKLLYTGRYLWLCVKFILAHFLRKPDWVKHNRSNNRSSLLLTEKRGVLVSNDRRVAEAMISRWGPEEAKPKNEPLLESRVQYK